MDKQLTAKTIKDRLSKVKKLPIEQIIRRDIRANYPGMTFEEGMAEFERLKSEGAGVVRFINTLFVVTNTDGNQVEFHTISGDKKEDYLFACLMFYIDLKKKGYEEAITFFENPAVIDELITWPDGDFEPWESVEEVNGGYLLRVDLNGLG